MSQSLSKLFIHIVYRVKTSSVKIREEEKSALHAYIGAIIKNNNSIPIIINGMDDHIHILCVMSKNIALATLVREIKSGSSRWIKSVHPHYNNFAWQGGYGAFSVSASLHDRTKRYIEKQEEHHRATSFQKEYLKFLKKYNIEFDERFLWQD